MKNLIKSPMLVLVPLVMPMSGVGGSIDPSRGCRNNPAVVAACFSIRGRISACNGSPTFRIWPLGSARVLGIEPSENAIVPENIKGKVSFEQSLVADLEVCPFTQARPGRMQLVCVETAANVELHRNR